MRVLLSFSDDDVLGGGERGVGRVLVAHHQREGDVVRRLVPHRRRARLHRVLDVDDRRQRLVVDLDQFGGVARLRAAFRRRRSATRSPTARTLSVARIARSVRKPFGPPMSSGIGGASAAELVGDDVGAGEHGEHAVRGLGLRGVDALDAGVGVRRHDEHAVALARQVDVVDIAAAAGDEARVLDPRDGLPDAELVQPDVHDVSPMFPRSRGRVIYTCELRQ